MRKISLPLLVLAAVGALSVCLFAQPAEKPEALPDAGKMTMDQLLEEFHHPRGMMGKPPPQRWYDIINALRRQGEPLVTRLRADLKNPDADVKIAAMRVLQNLGNVSRPAVPELVAAMSDPNERVRWSAVVAVGNLKDPRAFYALVGATRDPSPSVRRAALNDAGPSLADGRFATAVLALGDPDKFVRMSAILQMRALNDKRAVAFLAPLLDDAEVHSYSVREGVKTADRPCDQVAYALEYFVNGKYLLPGKETQEERDALVQKWKDWWKEHGAEFDAKLYAEPELKRSRE